MIIIPAVDIKDGKCVRLLQGRMEDETIFSDDPAAMAKRWGDQGAELIHVVDLNGAFEKSPQNLEAIKKIIKTVKADIQIGGGIRSRETVEMYLELGVRKVVLGTAAIQYPRMAVNMCNKYPDRIVIGIDARDGYVAVEGWSQTTRIRAADLAMQFEESGVAAVNFTDIHRDGMQTGPNIDATRELAEAVDIPVVASGGVSNIEDIQKLLPLEASGVTGIITGRALYSGTLDLREAIVLSKHGQT
ncbi:MAG: 1-(5-phosphoribosyl)-5-[(5-phosphoribosylamino)methylideneamino]imidazole-4-carboxamide isomerase [Desulfobacteraceae bacterium 4572_88]|nr:MAG: 1-(5-phosphoribosyl)-5-[(5-phosphoribosylamino)methylideneamino]imidazole-4-carboxamide isomerase [Desulfobacteraceae bacterium 4572_88]